jgi:hypothetical protein
VSDKRLSDHSELAMGIQRLQSAVNGVVLRREVLWCLDLHEVGVDTRVLDKDWVSHILSALVSVVISGCVCDCNRCNGFRASIIVWIGGSKSVSDLRDGDCLILIVVDNVVLNSRVGRCRDL